MDFKSIFVTLVVCIATSRKRIVQGEFVDIVLQFNDSNQNNYTRFINVTQQQFLWLSSVLCDSYTYSYNITYNRDNGSLVSNISTTFSSQKENTTIYLKEFMCTSTFTVFQCTRRQNNAKCDDAKISWIYHNTDTSSTCPDKCVTMCPIYPIQSIIPTYKTQTSKHSNNAECQNTIPQQISTLNFMSTHHPPSSPDNSKDTSPDDSLPVIIGACIGGGVFIIIAIIVFLVCLKKRQKQKQKNTKHMERSCDNSKSEINTNPRQFQPSELTKPYFSGSGVDYSSINDLHNEINNNADNNGGTYTIEPSHNNECGNNYSTLGDNTRLFSDTYSTLGEKARSVSDTYNVMPTVSHKKGHKSLGAISDYDNNRGNSSNVNLGDNVGQVDGAPNDVYAQVIKPLRKVHLKE